jgi:cytochrome c553
LTCPRGDGDDGGMRDERVRAPSGTTRPPAGAAAPPATAAQQIKRLQRSAGNAAVGRLMRTPGGGRVLARFVAPYTAPFIAAQLDDAMSGLGTDEDKIFAALSGVSRAELPQVESEYQKRTKKNLRAELQDELSDSDFKKIAVYRPAGVDSIAQQLHEAMDRLGTDENAVYAALAGRSAAEMASIAAAYKKRTGHELMADLQDELSRSELMKLGAMSPETAKTPQIQAAQIAEQLRDAIAGPGTNEDAVLAALNGRDAAMVAEIKKAYEKLTGSTLEYALRDDLSGDELDQSLSGARIDHAVRETDTELGGLMVGNFDFELAGGKVTITVRVKYQFTDDITATEASDFKKRFQSAVDAKWKNTGYKLHGEGVCAHPDLPIEVLLVEDPAHYHKVVDVEKQTDTQRRPNIMRDINVNLGTSSDTLAHEFGHVLGLYDEYEGPWYENMMFWHRNRPEDTNQLMDSGTELRPRYFEHIRERVQRAAPPGCVYHILPPP